MAKGRGDAVEGKSVTIEDVMQGRVAAEDISKLSFEQALGLLEGVVTAVESGNLPLDQAIGSYERGTELVQHLRALLTGAEEKLRMLSDEQ